jgi:hypothetical protein
VRLVDITRECDDGKPTPRVVADIEGFAVHRIWFDDWPADRDASPIEIARRFIDDPGVAKYTGGEVAYTFLVDHEGLWWQCLRLSDVGKHARRWSVPHIGVGVIGDFRKHPPPPAQRMSLMDGLAELCPALGINPLAMALIGNVSVPRIAGHDELPGGSADAAKRCPGQYLSMRDLRRDVAMAVERQALGRLAAAGVVG